MNCVGIVLERKHNFIRGISVRQEKFPVPRVLFDPLRSQYGLDAYARPPCEKTLQCSFIIGIVSRVN